MSDAPTIPLPWAPGYDPEYSLQQATAFNQLLQQRRSVRDFASTPVDRRVIEHCLLAAGSAPSGANLQPWHFVAISDAATKKAIREAAEAEEQAFYAHRASQEWLQALAPLGTDAQKPFLEEAAWLIAIFVRKHGQDAQGQKIKHYYPVESVGIATGLLIAALHQAGLATLTHTPSPMGFLCDLLGRPRDQERPFLLLVAGHPAAAARVPAIQRKPLSEIATFR